MIKFNLILILLLLLLSIFIIFTVSAESDNDCSCPIEEIFDSNWKDGVIKSPGFPLKYCGSLDCKWNIQPAENSFIYAKLESFATEERYDTLDVYQTRWNGSELIKLKQARLSGKIYDNPVDHIRFSSSINGGLLFHFITDGSTHNLGFRISFSRGSNDGSLYHFPCPKPFYFATNSSQHLPAFRLRFMDACFFTINSTEAIKLSINRFNKDSKFEMEVFETGNFPKLYVTHQGGQLAKIDRHSSVNSYPLIVKSTTKSVSVLIISHDMDNNVDVPYEIEYVAVKPCKCFPNNLTLCRIHPLNLLSPGFPEYCDNLNCSTQISLENPVNTSAYVESLQIQFNTFQTKLGDVLHLKMPYEKRELISFDGDAKKISFFTLDSPKFILNFTTNELGIDTGFNITIKYIKRNKECLCHGTDSNLKILDGKKISAQYTFDGKKCPFMDCFWEIKPPKHTKFYHRLIIKFNLSLADKNGEFVEVCPKNFNETNNDCQRLDKSNGVGNQIEFNVSKVSTFFKKDASVNVWYHREPDKWIYSPNIPRQINFTYEWKELTW